jgi:ankyrin repeat protein
LNNKIKQLWLTVKEEVAQIKYNFEQKNIIYYIYKHKNSAIDSYIKSGKIDFNYQDDREHLTHIIHAIMANNHYFMNKYIAQVKHNAGIDVNLLDPDHSNVVHWLVYYNNFDLLKSLLKASAGRLNLNQQNNDGYTPLMLAINNHNTEMTNLLLKEGANINCANHTGNTALMKTIKNNDKELFDLLMAKHYKKSILDLEQRNHLGETALMLAANNFYFVTELIKAGSDLDAVDLQGNTALFHCARFNNKATAQLLLDNNCDSNITNNNNMDFRQYALSLHKDGFYNFFKALDNDLEVKEQKCSSCKMNG